MLTKKLLAAKIAGHPVLFLLIRLFLSYLFIYAAMQKIINPQNFAMDIINYQMIPMPLINLIALGLPMLELLIGIAVIAGPYIREAALWMIFLNSAFIAGMISAVARGLSIDCGCGLPGESKTVGIDTILRDIFFLLLSIAIFLFPRKRITISVQLEESAKLLSFTL